MTLWPYRVPPDIGITVAARNRPSLLERCLGDGRLERSDVSLRLDLNGNQRHESPHREQVAHGVYKAIPWSCRITPLTEEGWALGFESPVMREYLALHIALLPALGRLLVERGVALFVGAAFEIDGVGTLLAARTGHGKTTALLGALERGATLIGDEFIGLSRDAQMTPVLDILGLRQATLALAPRTLQRLSKSRRRSLRAARLAALLTRNHLDPLVHVSLDEVGASRVSESSTRAQRLFWLEPEAGESVHVRCEPMDPREAVELLSIPVAAHDCSYGDLGALLDATGNGHAKESYGSRWRQTLARALSDIACYRLTFPAGSLPPEVLEYVLGTNAR